MTTTIKTHAYYSTKRLARELGMPRPTLIASLRDLSVPLHWNEGTRSWEIINAADAAQAAEFFATDILPATD